MKHIPRSSRIFIGIFIITLLLTYIAITLSSSQERYIFDYGMQNTSDTAVSEAAQQTVIPANTAGWISYTDNQFPLTFSHPKEWVVTSNNNVANFYTIAINVPNNPADIHIYIGGEYLGLDGLEQKPYTTKNGAQGVNVNNTLIGIKTGETHYTFDAALNSAQLSEFAALLDTVTIQSNPAVQ